jgi:hypothetical protein
MAGGQRSSRSFRSFQLFRSLEDGRLQREEESTRSSSGISRKCSLGADGEEVTVAVAGGTESDSEEVSRSESIGCKDSS